MSQKRKKNNEQQIVESIISLIKNQEEFTQEPFNYSPILDKLQEHVKNKKMKKSDRAELKETSITQLSSDELFLIYSFAGVENVFYNQIYNINHEMKEKIYENSLFWKHLFNLIWKCSIIDEKFDWIYLRKCCFHKFNSFHIQKLANPHFISGSILIDRLETLDLNHFTNFIDQPCHILKYTQPCYQLQMLSHQEGHIAYCEIDCDVNVYLKEKPICANLNVKGSTYFDGNQMTDLEIKARIAPEFSSSNEWIEIFDINMHPLSGILKLFNVLQLDMTELNVPPWESINILNHYFTQPIREDKYFRWFCDSILSGIPMMEFIFRNSSTDYFDYIFERDAEEIYMENVLQ